MLEQVSNVSSILVSSIWVTSVAAPDANEMAIQSLCRVQKMPDSLYATMK
jgi:hypothetical protein